MEKKTHLTMQDIARAAGVSSMTVSRALRNDPQNSASTRERVKALAEKMGYHSNPLISAFNARRQSQRDVRYNATLAVFVSSAEDVKLSVTVGRMFQGLEARAKNFGYGIDMYYWNEIVSPERTQRMLRTRGMVGIIFMPMKEAHTTALIDVSSYACASMGYTLESPDLHRAVHHHFHGMHLALQTLKERGYQRIGFADNMHMEERVWRLWRSAFMTHGGRSTFPVFPHRYDPQKGSSVIERFKRWFDKYKPDAIITSDVNIAEMAERANLKVPRDVALALLDSGPGKGAVSGIDQLPERVGAGSFDLVMDQLHRNERGVPEYSKTVLTKGCWFEGSGTAPPKL